MKLCLTFQQDIDEVFEKLIEDIGTVPGKYLTSKSKSIFQTAFMAKKFSNHLKEKEIQSNVSIISDNDCFALSDCKKMLLKGYTFITKANLMFPRRLTNLDFLDERPDFHLGNFLSMFPQELDEIGVNFDELEPMDDENAKQINAIMRNTFEKLSEFFSFNFVSGAILRNISNTDPDMYLKLIKYSENDFIFTKNADENYFFSEFVNKSVFSKIANMAGTKFLEDHPKIIHFCDATPLYSLIKNLQRKQVHCKDFEPILTARGLCYSFNALPMKEVFKASTIVSKWESVFEKDRKVNKFKPTGFGSIHGLNFVLNSFHTDASKRGQSFAMSITKHNFPFERYKPSFQIKPGYAYTFKVGASKISTTERFDSLDKRLRDCALISDDSNSNLTKIYSQTSCEYECLINNAKKNVGCIPWNIPRVIDNDTHLCDIYQSVAFTTEMETFPTTECNCLPDCKETTLTVYDTSRILDLKHLKCSNFKLNNSKKNYPDYIFCDLCQKIVKHYRIKLLAEFMSDLGESQKMMNNIILDELCIKIISENVATVKVEMATKSITKSVKDKRYNFTTQISSLGEKTYITAKIS